MAIQTPGIKRSNLSKQGKESVPVKPTSSYTQILCKSLLFALFLIALPLFPSQAPGFVNQTILPKFWELIHLLFVGIAVSYGLFSRRNVDTEFDCSHSSVDDSQSYMCNIFDVSSSLGNGVETPSGFVKKSVHNSLNSRFVKSESSSDVSEGSCLFDEQNGHRTFDFESGRKPYNDRSVIQAWNSQYFQRESIVVVAQPNCGLDEHINHRPLGLPVRSLKSSVKYSQISESSDDGGSGSSLKASSDCYGGSTNDLFGHMSPNLNHKLMENVAPIPWSWISGQMEVRENIKDSPPPPLVEESRSFRSATRTSSMSHSPSRLSTSQSESSNSGMDESGKGSNAVSQSQHYSHGSLTDVETSEDDSFGNLDYRRSDLISEDEELENEEEEEKSFLWSYPPLRAKGVASMNELHSPHYGHGSLLEEETRRGSEDETKDLNGYPLTRRRDRGAQVNQKEKSFRKSYPSTKQLHTSTSPPANDRASRIGLHSRHNTYDSLLEEEVRGNSEYDFKDSIGNRRKDSLRRNTPGSSSLKLAEKQSMDGRNLRTSTSPPGTGNRLHARHHSQGSLVEKDTCDRFESDFERFSDRKKDYNPDGSRRESKPITNTKTSTRGKSVRTFRCGRRAMETVGHEEKLGKRLTDNDEDTNELKSRELESLSGGRNYSRPKQQRSLEDEKRRRHDDSEFDTESEGEQHEEVSSREEGRDSEAGHDESNEVDKKAGEFIAKFREQIRLQKMGSVEKPRMLSIDDKYITCRSTRS